MKRRFPRENVLWLLGCFAIFLIHQIAQAVGWHVKLLDNYLDPFLAVPIMLGVTVFSIRIFQSTYTLTPLTIIIYTLGLIAFFESGWVEDEKLHPDVWDIPGYLVGAVLYHWKINPSNEDAR